MKLEELVKENTCATKTRIIDLNGNIYKIHKHDFEKDSVDFRLN